MFLRYEAQDAVQSHQEADVQVFTHCQDTFMHLNMLALLRLVLLALFAIARMFSVNPAWLRRPHVPRDAEMRDVYRWAGMNLPGVHTC